MKRAAACLISVAMIALSGLAASSAYAEGEFHLGEESAAIEGEITEPLEVVTETGVMICEAGGLTGESASSTPESLVLLPSFEECEFEELFEVAFAVNGCVLVLNTDGSTVGSMDIVCPGSTVFMQFGSLLTCRVRIPPQSDLTPITYHNGISVVVVAVEVANLTHEEAGLFCSGVGGAGGLFRIGLALHSSSGSMHVT